VCVNVVHYDSIREGFHREEEKINVDLFPKRGRGSEKNVKKSIMGHFRPKLCLNTLLTQKKKRKKGPLYT
jgi:hypothetical protein